MVLIAINVCIECDSCYHLVTLEVNKLSELAANISTVADAIVPCNSSMIIGDTFFERLQQTRNSLQDLLTFVSCFVRLCLDTNVVIREIPSVKGSVGELY